MNSHGRLSLGGNCSGGVALTGAAGMGVSVCPDFEHRSSNLLPTLPSVTVTGPCEERIKHSMSSNHTTVSLLQKSFQHFSTLFKYINGAAFSGNHVVRLSGYPCIICIGRIVTRKGRSCFLSHVDSLSPLGYHLLPNRNIHGLKGSEPAQHGFLVETFFWRIKSANWAHVFGVKTTPGNASEANNP